MVSNRNFEPKILGFLCNWCCYAGADLAGVSRYQYPPNIRSIRLMCSGRVDMHFIIRAFLNDTDGVFIGGCWLGDCHYLTQGNYQALNLVYIMKRILLEIGINPDRLKINWVSSAQGLRFAETVTEFTGRIKELGPLGLDDDKNGKIMRLKLESVRSTITQIKIVEWKKLRAHFKTEAEYDEFYKTEEAERILRETIIDRLRLKQITLLLREGPLTNIEIAEALRFEPADVAHYLAAAAKQGLMRFDDSRKTYAVV